MRGNQRSALLAACAVIGAALVWSTSYAVTKKVLGGVGPLTIGAIRFTLAAAVLHVVMRLRRRGGSGCGARPDARQRRAMYRSGLLGITAYFIFENIGVQLSTATDASLIVATYPLMTMLLERAVLRTSVPWHRVGGVLLAAAGAALVVRGGHDAGGSDRLLGDALLMAAGLTWAGYSIVAKSAGLKQDPVTLTYYQTLAGAAGFLLASLVEAPQWKVPSAGDVLLLVYLAAACSVGGFLLYNYGLRTMSSSAAVNVMNIVPVCGVLSAVLIDGERVSLPQVLGGAVIIAGVTLGMLDRAPAPSPAASEAAALFEQVDTSAPGVPLEPLTARR